MISSQFYISWQLFVATTILGLVTTFTLYPLYLIIGLRWLQFTGCSVACCTWSAKTSSCVIFGVLWLMF